MQKITPFLLQDKDAEKSQRVMKAMMQMGKIDIERLRQAFEGGR
jgi:predicted 3-demethylubiquinone-9 3-methyltransferase (glyoxalase superfamily)